MPTITTIQERLIMNKMKYIYTREDYICEEIIRRIKKESLNESVNFEHILTAYKIIKNAVEALRSGFAKIPSEHLKHLQSICKNLKDDITNFFNEIFWTRSLDELDYSKITRKEWKTPAIPKRLKDFLSDITETLKSKYTRSLKWQDVAVVTGLNTLQTTFTKALNIVAAAVGAATSFAGESLVKAVGAAAITFGIDYFGKGLRDTVTIAKDCLVAAGENAGEIILGPINNFLSSDTYQDAAYNAKWRESGRGETVTYRENGREYQAKPSYVKRKDDERRARLADTRKMIDRYVSLYKTDDWKNTLARANAKDNLAEKFNWSGIGANPKASPYDCDRYGEYIYAPQISIMLTVYDNQKKKDREPKPSTRSRRPELPHYTNPTETTRVATPPARTSLGRR